MTEKRPTNPHDAVVAIDRLVARLLAEHEARAKHVADLIAAGSGHPPTTSIDTYHA